MRKDILTKLIVLTLSLTLAVSLFAVCADATVKKILRVWDTFTEEDTSLIVEKIIESFEKKHPDCKVERRMTAAEDVRKTIKLALTSGVPLDVFYYETGPAFGEVLVKAGLVEFLDDAYRKRGWNKRVTQGARDIATVKGKTYAIPYEAEFIVNWYNVDLFNRLGLNVPTTWEEYTAICQKMADNNIVSWPWGDRKGIWYTWTQAPFFEAVAGGSMVLKALEGEVPWNSPEFVKAVEIEKEFYEKGYFNRTFSAIDYSEVQIMFYTEKAGMFPTGTWMKAYFYERKKDGTFDFDYDFFVTPPYKPGIDAGAPGGLGSCWFVSAASQHKKEALDFLGETISDEAVKLNFNVGFVPPLNLSDSFLAKIELDPVMSRIVKGVKKMHKAATNVHLPGSVNDYLFHNAPLALRGEITPKELQDRFQALYQEYLKAQ